MSGGREHGGETNDASAVPTPVLDLLQERQFLVMRLKVPQWTPAERREVKQHLPVLVALRERVRRRYQAWLGDLDRETLTEIEGVEQAVRERLAA